MERHCSGRACFELLGRKWAAHVIWALRDGSRRFSELMAAIPGVSDRMLARRLQELAAEGIVTRTLHAEVPARVEYELTSKGDSLGPVIRELSLIHI